MATRIDLQQNFISAPYVEAIFQIWLISVYKMTSQSCIQSPETGHRTLETGHRRSDTQVILYSVQCCYALDRQ